MSSNVKQRNSFATKTQANQLESVKQRQMPIHRFQEKMDPGIDWTYKQDPLPQKAKSEVELSLPKSTNVQVGIQSYQVPQEVKKRG